MTTIKDIAERCSVSVSTVSRVLNDHPDVSSTVRERVLKVIDEVGIDKKLREEYILFIKQDAIIRTIENCFTCLNRSKKEKKEVIAVINRYSNVFQVESVRKYDKRPKRLFYLLRYNLVPVAISYVYLDSLYRKLRKKLNL